MQTWNQKVHFVNEDCFLSYKGRTFKAKTLLVQPHQCPLTHTSLLHLTLAALFFFFFFYPTTWPYLLKNVSLHKSLAPVWPLEWQISVDLSCISAAGFPKSLINSQKKKHIFHPHFLFQKHKLSTFNNLQAIQYNPYFQAMMVSPHKSSTWSHINCLIDA